MKIALVCSEVIRESGHGRYMQELARRLAAEHEVHVYSHLYQPVPGAIHHPVPAPLGVNLFRIFAFFLSSTFKLGRTPYDVVHSIGGCTWRHDVVTAQFCQRAWGAELKKQAPLAPGAGLAARLRRWYHELYWRAADLLEAPAFRTRPDRRLIAVSKGVRDELARFYDADPAQVAVIYNGVEPAEFAPEALAVHRDRVRGELGFEPDEPVLLFVGDFYRKGLMTVLAAMAKLKTPKVRLLVVGRGEVDAFQARASELGLNPVVFVGFQKDVVPYFAAADAFVFPTRYEPFGMVITEAMAAALPVVTTASAGASEVITPGVDGLVLQDPDDADALALALDDLLADPARRSAMGAAAREAAKRVDWDYVAAETLKVYEDLLSSRAS
jgi:glycosyltransferase involved in cell wall biosynthesis